MQNNALNKVHACQISKKAMEMNSSATKHQAAPQGTAVGEEGCEMARVVVTLQQLIARIVTSSDLLTEIVTSSDLVTEIVASSDLLPQVTSINNKNRSRDTCRCQWEPLT